MLDTYLRKAEFSDMDLLFFWVNDDAVRENSFNPQEIEYEDHKEWFANKMSSGSSIIYIYCKGEMPIGQARIDVDGDSGLISYSIENTHRQKGHAGLLLTLLENTVISDLPEVKTLIARVKKSNIVSQRKFEQRMYEKLECGNCFEYRKIL